MTKEEKILEARRMNDTKHFDRKVVGRKPTSMFDDELTLECGHTVLTMARLEPRETHTCFDCAAAWMKGAE